MLGESSHSFELAASLEGGIGLTSLVMLTGGAADSKSSKDRDLGKTETILRRRNCLFNAILLARSVAEKPASIWKEQAYVMSLKTISRLTEFDWIEQL